MQQQSKKVNTAGKTSNKEKVQNLRKTSQKKKAKKLADKALVDGIHCPLAISTGRRSAQQNPWQKSHKCGSKKMTKLLKSKTKLIGD